MKRPAPARQQDRPDPRGTKRVKSASEPWSKSRKEKEAETDSDPIIESDTTSQSGVDDGVSWPSDAEQEDDALEEESDADKSGTHNARSDSKPQERGRCNKVLWCIAH